MHIICFVHAACIRTEKDPNTLDLKSMSFASPVFRNRFSLFKEKKNLEEIKKDLALLEFQNLA